jgi:hypothetical protein
MQHSSYSSFDFDATNMAMSQIYQQKHSEIFDKIPKKIGNRKDIYEIKTGIRDKPRGASNLYKLIKKHILLRLDEIEEDSTKSIKNLTNQIIDFLNEKKIKNGIKETIKTNKESREQVHELIIYYNEFYWFKDSNLLSTIRFHEKLNEIFLSKAEESLQYKIDKSKIEQVIKNMIEHPEYIKAIIVVTFQPILTYGAIYAATQNDYEYIIKYESVLSETAEILFKDNPNLKMRFFEQELA